MRRLILLAGLFLLSALACAFLQGLQGLAAPAFSIATQTPSPSATSSPTPIPTPTSTPINPLSIEYLRLQEFPGSELTIERTLEAGPNYNRYIASYQSEGLTIYGLLTIPYGERPESGWPAIVFNHGYIPPDQYRTTERYVAYVDGFARSGYVVLRPDYRGHDQSEGEATSAYRSPGYVIDVLNAVAALKAFEPVDAGRIGMWGHSMGGYITLRAMVTDPDIRAGVIWAGVVGSYEDMYRLDDRPRYGSRTLAALFGPPESNPEMWALISANSYLEDLSGPIQMHHGTGDDSVLPAFSESLAEDMESAGRYVELYYYEGDDHNLSYFFSQAMSRSIDFFDRWVKEFELLPLE